MYSAVVTICTARFKTHSSTFCPHSVFMFFCVWIWEQTAITHSIQHSSSWEANRFSEGQEIPRILWSPKVHHRIHKCLPPVPILSQLSSFHALTSYSRSSILILSSHLHMGFPSGLFPSGYPIKTVFMPLLSPIRATHPAHLILLDLNSRIISGEQCRSLSSSLCSFLHSPNTSSLLSPNILRNTLFLNTLSLRSSLNMSDPVSHPYKTTDKIIFLYITILNFWIVKCETKFCAEW